MSAGEAKIDPCSDPSAPARRVPLSLTALGRVAEVVGECAAEPLQIGPYILRERIGDGGMGVVYRAEQQHPIQRTVALKLIKPGMDSREVIARFESERQALAMMSHRNVAKVLDAGTSEEGRPYFVMEHVPGLPITRYCDEHQYTLKQRLELFIQACEAVQHAHQKAIIHRDLKPSNILVTGENGDAEVKVIDFGVAKALSPTLEQQHTLYTHAGQLIGTPEYMSPEQAGSNGQGVDTRSDIYSLGVVLYELLAGALPFDSETLRNSSVAEIQRMIRELDPPRPSTRLSALGDVVGEIARNRGSHLEELTRLLRCELEWIPLKAMRKEPEQRYASAGELAEDIRNYLDHRPLVAGPESRVYRLRKFVTRNKAPIAIAVAFAVVLAAGITLYILGIRNEQAKTLAALAEVQQQRNEAEAAKVSAQAVRDFLTESVLAAARPERVPDKSVRDTIVAVVLEPAAASVAEKFGSEPLTEAAVRYTLAISYNAIGETALGLPHAEIAMQLRRRLLGDEHPDTLNSISLAAKLLEEMGRFEEAEPLFRQGMEGRRRVLGDDHADTISATNNMAYMLNSLGRYNEAEPLYRGALERSRRVLGDDHSKTLMLMSNLGTLLERQKRFAEAAPLLTKSLEGRRRILGADHPTTIGSLSNLASLFAAQGNWKEAELLYREALEQYRRVLGAEHPDTLRVTVNLALTLEKVGNLEEAESLYRDSLQHLRRLLGNDHPRTLHAVYGMGRFLLGQGRLREAEPLLREALEGQRRVHGDDHPNTIIAAKGIFKLLQERGETAEADALCRELLGRLRSGNSHEAMSLKRELALILADQAKFAEAEVLLRELLEELRSTRGRDHPDTLEALSALGTLLFETDRAAEAEPLLRERLEAQRRTRPATTPAE